MVASLTERVRGACKAVAERATRVRIDHERIPSYAASLPLEEAMAPELDPKRHYFGEPDETVAFFLTLDAINFGSGYFPFFRKRSGMSGYFTVAASLTDHYKQHAPLPARELAELTAKDCTKIFGQNPDNEPIREFMGLFAAALNDLGRYLLDRFGGSFMGLVEEAGSSAERLARLLVEMPYFDDVELYGGLEVPFYKRAQLAPADLAVAFAGKGPGRFEDLHRLTIFADNLVPHVLRVDGVLLYEEGLAAHIDAKELVPPGSVEEVEIRACSVHAVERLVGELRRSGYDATAMGLDYLLWNRGQQPYYKARPRHRTRTVFY
jgi:Potential Queuosine, Q, salvage protein family